ADRVAAAEQDNKVRTASPADADQDVAGDIPGDAGHAAEAEQGDKERGVHAARIIDLVDRKPSQKRKSRTGHSRAERAADPAGDAEEAGVGEQGAADASGGGADQYEKDPRGDPHRADAHHLAAGTDAADHDPGVDRGDID